MCAGMGGEPEIVACGARLEKAVINFCDHQSQAGRQPNHLVLRFFIWRAEVVAAINIAIAICVPIIESRRTRWIVCVWIVGVGRVC